ncbi:MAG: tetratricopeptide repeat protein [Myxococcota bacterium]
MSVLSRAGIAGVLAFALATPASAADKGTSLWLRSIEGDAGDVSKEVEEVRLNFTERSGLIGVAEARERYEDAVYLFLVQDYEAAATSFYILVQSRALGNVDLARDSEWYLAECLFEMGNYRTAEEAYRAIVNKGESHPYFVDSIRRILEVYGLLGDTQGFDTYYNTYIVSGKVAPTELINYTLAKTFYRRGELARAKAMFDVLPEASPYFTRARYFMGVMMIKEKNYTQAIAEFKRIETHEVTDDDHKQVLDLAHLALARLYYETGAFGDAAVYYGKISKDSPWFADQLYESVWTYIKQANWLDALHQVDVFLLAYPEHRYAAGLKLLQGHLYMKSGSYDQARTAYEKVVQDYTPIVERLENVGGGPAEMRALLTGMTDDKTTVQEGLPAYAMEMLLSREDVSRAATAWEEVQRQKEELASSERTLKDLELALSEGGANILGSFVAARTALSGARGNAVSLRDQLLDCEASYLKKLGASRGELAAIQKEREAVMSDSAEEGAQASAGDDKLQIYDEQIREVQSRAFRLSQIVQEQQAALTATRDQIAQSKLKAAEAAEVRTHLEDQERELNTLRLELEQLSSEIVRRKILRTVEAPIGSGDDERNRARIARYDGLRRRLAALRSYATDADAAATFAQIDRLWAQLDKVEQGAEETYRILTTAESRELALVQRRLQGEAERVRELRTTLDTQGADTEALAARVLAAGVDGLEDEFMGSVLEADKGIVDVYWLRKSGASDEREELITEQNKLLRELDEQFRIVRENLDR